MIPFGDLLAWKLYDFHGCHTLKYLEIGIPRCVRTQYWNKFNFLQRKTSFWDFTFFSQLGEVYFQPYLTDIFFLLNINLLSGIKKISCLKHVNSLKTCQFLEKNDDFWEIYVWSANLEGFKPQKTFSKYLSNNWLTQWKRSKPYLLRISSRNSLSDGSKFRFFEISANFDLNFRGQGVQIARKYYQIIWKYDLLTF